MMKNLVVVFLFLLCCACDKKTEEKKAQVNYVIEEFRAESAGGCKSDTIACAYYEVNYPAFTGLDAAVESILKQRLDAAVSMGNPEAEGQTMKQIGEGFIKDFEDFMNDIPGVSAGWHYTAEVKVEMLLDTLLSLSIQEEYYTGGAHGGYGTYFINLNPSTGAEFTLDNFLKSGYNEPLTNLGEEVFRRVRDLRDTTSLNENDFEFPDDKFQLNKNYGFRKEGIVFFYNSYEIAAYAAGPTEVLIPYEKLVEWIK
jgi:hypothetical protein